MCDIQYIYSVLHTVLCDERSNMEKNDIISGMIMELRRGTIVLCVLSQLEEPMYGYSLVSALSESGIAVEANTLYPLLRRLESQGMLESKWETDNGPKPRKYYCITKLGNEVLTVMKNQWEQTVKSMEVILRKG